MIYLIQDSFVVSVLVYVRNMSAQEVLKSKKYEFVPPDGGWGYVIGVAVTIILVSSYE